MSAPNIDTTRPNDAPGAHAIPARHWWRFDELGLVLALLVLIVVIALPNPDFLSTRSLVTILRQAAFVGIITFGMVYLLSMVELDLSVGGTYAVAATLGGVLMRTGVDPWLAALAALATGAALGAFNGMAANLLHVPAIIVSLGTLSAYRGINLLLSDGRAVIGLPGDHAFFRLFGSRLFGVPSAVWVFLAVGVVLHVVYVHTRFGATVKAIGSNPAAARFVGIRVARVRLVVLTLVGLLCGLSGVLTLAFFEAADPSLGLGLELSAIAAAVIGGTSLEGGSGTLFGALLGVLLIATINAGLVFFGVSANWGQLVTGLVILGAIGLDRTIKLRRAPG